MRALIFAAGLGTRLRPITDSIPKALVEVGGVAMLGRVIDKIAGASVTRIAVNAHHFPDKIIDYVRSYKCPKDVTLTVSDERDYLLETGGGLAKLLADTGIDEDILAHNADILTDFPIGEMMSLHRDSGADITLLTQRRDTTRYLLFDADMRMRGWNNAKTAEVRPGDVVAASCCRFAFGGVHILSPVAQRRLLEYSGGVRKFSIIDFYVDCCRDLVIKGYVPEKDYLWIDIGKPESLELACRYFGGRH